MDLVVFYPDGGSFGREVWPGGDGWAGCAKGAPDGRLERGGDRLGGGGERRLEAKGLRGLMPLRVGKWKRPFASDLPVRSGKRFETEFTVILFKYMGHLSLFVEIFFLEKIMNFHIL